MRKLLLSLLACTLVASTAWAADIDKKKLSASTQQLLHNQATMAASKRAPETQKPISAFVHIASTDAIAQMQNLGVIIDSEFDGFVTARIPANVLNDVIDLPSVTYVNVAEKVTLHSDSARIYTQVYDVLNFTQAARDAGLETAYTGQGVIVGVVDMGIDFRHKAFKDVNGKCRISHAYYNKQLSLQPDTIVNTGEYSHGTHTSSIAAGSSVINDNENATVTVTNEHDRATWGGMAPDAELYLCEATDLRNVDVVNYYKAIADYAYKSGKPCVINSSFGINVGPHDGTGELCAAVNQLTKRNNVIFVKAAGNSNTDKMYTYAKISANSGANILWLNPWGMTCDENSDIDQDQGGYFGVFARTPETRFTVQTHIVDTITGQLMYSSPVYHFDSKYNLNAQDKIEYQKYFNGYINVQMAYDINNGKYYSYLRPVYIAGDDDTGDFYKEDAPNFAVITTILPENDNDEFYIDAWANYTSFGDNNTISTSKLAGFTTTPASDDCCVGTEDLTMSYISVGAYITRLQEWTYGNDPVTLKEKLGDIAFFSSYSDPNYGPLSNTDDAMSRPDVAAPGYWIVAAVPRKSNDSFVNTDAQNPYACNAGTSMASPVVTGIVALWMQVAQANGIELNTDSIRHIINVTGDHDQFTNDADGTYKVVFGPGGKINALKGIAYILNRAAEQSSVTETTLPDKPIASVRYVTLDGKTSTTPFPGVNLIVTRFTDGTEHVTKQILP